jgi:hypothetical protein
MDYILTFIISNKQGSLKMIIEKGRQGQWIISEIIDSYLITKTFFGYTKKMAIKLFKKEIKKEREVK